MKEPKYEMISSPIRYGQTHAPARMSSEGRFSGELLASEIASSTKPTMIASTSFQTTGQPEKRMISLATMKPTGAR